MTKDMKMLAVVVGGLAVLYIGYRLFQANTANQVAALKQDQLSAAGPIPTDLPMAPAGTPTPALSPPITPAISPFSQRLAELATIRTTGAF